MAVTHGRQSVDYGFNNNGVYQVMGRPTAKPIRRKATGYVHHRARTADDRLMAALDGSGRGAKGALLWGDE